MRTFHRQIRAAARRFDTCLTRSRLQVVAQACANRVGHRNMRDTARPKEALFPRKCAVDKLVNDHEHPRAEIFPERAHSRDGNHVGNTSALQRIDIGPEIDLRRRNLVAAPVPWEKHQRLPVKLAKHQLIGWLPERGVHPNPALVAQPFNVINTAAANDSEHLFGLVTVHMRASLKNRTDKCKKSSDHAVIATVNGDL